MPGSRDSVLDRPAAADGAVACLPDPWAGGSDPLGEALHFLRMSGTFYAASELTAPWGLSLPALPDTMMLHVVTSGRCWLDLPEAAPRLLEPGVLALVPHGRGHHLYSDAGAPLAELFDVPRVEIGDRYECIQFGGGGEPTSLVCAVTRCDHPAARQLTALLPAVVSLEDRHSPHVEWMQTLLQLMAAEAMTPRPGGATVIARLADILVIQTIRAWIDKDPAAQTGWLGALRDPQIGRALSLIHRDPARRWTVAALARDVGMSRSVFAARFSSLVGEPAMQYVTRWRMHVALERLRADATPVADLASRLGYESEAAFSRAFKRVIGLSPGAARPARAAVR
jgi:AraC-like DNA-binding protein